TTTRSQLPRSDRLAKGTSICSINLPVYRGLSEARVVWSLVTISASCGVNTSQHCGRLQEERPRRQRAIYEHRSRLIGRVSILPHSCAGSGLWNNSGVISSDRSGEQSA